MVKHTTNNSIDYGKAFRVFNPIEKYINASRFNTQDGIHLMDVWSTLKAYHLDLGFQVDFPKGNKEQEVKSQEEEESNLQQEKEKRGQCKI